MNAGQLESESRVLAFGLDLLGSTVSPSRSFDVLSPSFNKLQLLVTVTLLSSALLVTQTTVSCRLFSKQTLGANRRLKFCFSRSDNEICSKSGMRRSAQSLQ